MKGPALLTQHTPSRRRCSFCGASEPRAGRLHPGTGGAAICDSCVVRLFAHLDREAFNSIPAEAQRPDEVWTERGPCPPPRPGT
ncbi:ClpX C4-type zinc finger protein [Myxococcus stipitatus]|uniref:ClpX C4-type zinc finger protein n=1 Tax=Myxococcus stipitatus TaxID=83455 RepID=UPI003CC8E110